MIEAILDSNIFVQAAFGRPNLASYRAIRAHESGQYGLVFSEETIDELIEVLSLPRMRERLGWSEDDILDFVLSFVVDSLVYVVARSVSHTKTRDVTDAKFLTLAEESGADFLVTNDRRHLLRLKEHGRTRIVAPAQFLRELRAADHS
jgi:putative PIN family toxin of toxin-antitoxin system